MKLLNQEEPVIATLFTDHIIHTQDSIQVISHVGILGCTELL